MYHCNKISPGSKIAIAKNRKKAANFVDIDQFVPILRHLSRPLVTGDAGSEAPCVWNLYCEKICSVITTSIFTADPGTEVIEQKDEWPPITSRCKGLEKLFRNIVQYLDVSSEQ